MDGNYLYRAFVTPVAGNLGIVGPDSLPDPIQLFPSAFAKNPLAFGWNGMRVTHLPYLEAEDIVRLQPHSKVRYDNSVSQALYRIKPLGKPFQTLSRPVAIEAIERIEVVRGPNAPTFGSNAVLGSINIVTRAPFLMSGTYLRGTFGGEDTEIGVARWAGSIGGWDSSITAQYRADDGFDGVNDHKRLSDLRFRGDYQATVADTVSVQLGMTSGEAGVDAPVLDPAPGHGHNCRNLSWSDCRSSGPGWRHPAVGAARKEAVPRSRWSCPA